MVITCRANGAGGRRSPHSIGRHLRCAARMWCVLVEMLAAD
jgi:hypothetical protein